MFGRCVRGGASTERGGTGKTVVDTAACTGTFTDVDLTYRPLVSAAISTTDTFKYLDAQGHDITHSLSLSQLAAILVTEVPLTVVQAAENGHNGSATWTYSLTDSAFDFLAAGETLILNYVAQVDDGHGGVVSTPISVSVSGADVTIGGTNDVPTILPGAAEAIGGVIGQVVGIAPVLVFSGIMTVLAGLAGLLVPDMRDA